MKHLCCGMELVELAEESMAENPHYRELLQLLNEFEVEYLIVAVRSHEVRRAAVYQRSRRVVHNSPQNSARVVGALRKLVLPRA